MKKGKFIVLEGTDGSGKATQTKLLVDVLKKKGVSVVTTDFPQYESPSAYFVEKYLRGEYGTAEEVGPYVGSIFYAVDRYDKSFDIKKWLSQGKTVISNRYVSANMGHQAGKISDKKKRDEYLKWLATLEYEMFGIPRPDQTVFLHVAPEIGQRLVGKKATRTYTKGKKRDIHEADIDHLRKAFDAYLYVAKKYKWKTVDCTENGVILPIETIHKKILSALHIK